MLIDTITLPIAIFGGLMVGLFVTGLLTAQEKRPWYVFVALALINSMVSILTFAGLDALSAWLGG